MDSLVDIVYGLVRALSDKNELSVSRIVKSVYLFDWSRLLNSHVKHPELTWILSICGPDCSLIANLIERNTDMFSIEPRDDNKGGTKQVARLKQVDYQPALSEISIKAIKHVARVTKGMRWESLQQLLSSTMPVIMARVGSAMNLQAAAEARWKEIQS